MSHNDSFFEEIYGGGMINRNLEGDKNCKNGKIAVLQNKF